MIAKFGPLGFQPDDRYRNIAEAHIIDMLLLSGWAYDLGSTGAATACTEALERWAQIGLGSRPGNNGQRFFDPVEVSNFLKRAGLDGRDNFWPERYVRTGRRLVSDLAGDGNQEQRQFVVDFRRTFNLRSIAPETRLRLRVPLPREGDHLRNLQVAPRAEANAEITVEPGRLEARLTASGQAEMTVGATLCFSSRPQKPSPGEAVAEPDLPLYLRPREGLIVVSERISALANSLAPRGTPSLEAVRAFWDYLNRELICGALHYDQIDAASPCDWVLDSGWFDCQMGCALLVSLCRAQGIPARLVGGRVLYRLAPTNHYWAEIWIENQGWTPFDFLSWDLSEGGRDPQWRDHFFGRLDCRMTTERLPREFTGALGLPIPRQWSLLQFACDAGVEVSFLDGNGSPLYSDTVRVTESLKA